MNWWLISGSGAIGLALGLASINGYTRGSELLPVVLVFCWAFVIARLAAARHFANGLLAGFLGGLVAIIVIATSKSGFWTFLCNNPEIASRLQSEPGETERAQVFLLEIGPVFSILSGLVLGSLSWLFVRMPLGKNFVGKPN